MSKVQFHIHRKSAFAGALLPYPIYINGEYIGTIRNGKLLDVTVPKADVYFMDDDIFSSRNAVLYYNGLPEYNIVIKRAGGWRTESYNEFYIKKGETLEQLPSFHWETLFELRQTMSYSERTLALCVNFWISAADSLQKVLSSEHLFEIITALQTIGAHKYHNLLLNIMKNNFCDVEFPLNYDRIEKQSLKKEDANRTFWDNTSARAEFRKAVTNFIITNLNDSDHVF